MAITIERERIHIKKGDTVEVMGGRQRGKRGKVLKVLPKHGKVIIEGVNVVKRHTKPTQKMPQGGIVEKEAPVYGTKGAGRRTGGADGRGAGQSTGQAEGAVSQGNRTAPPRAVPLPERDGSAEAREGRHQCARGRRHHGLAVPGQGRRGADGDRWAAAGDSAGKEVDRSLQAAPGDPDRGEGHSARGPDVSVRRQTV